MNLKRISFFTTAIFFTFIFVTCTKYRDFPVKSGGTFTPPPAGTITFGSLRINEFICKGANPNAQTYLGSNEKWFELYNPTSAQITLTPGKWFVTDTLGDSLKFEIPADTFGLPRKVPANGYLVIMCQKTGAGGTLWAPGRVNASFSLSSTVGDIGIYYQDSTIHKAILVDGFHYNFPSGALSGVSYGRLPDGQNPATLQLSTVTPEAKNQ